MNSLLHQQKQLCSLLEFKKQFQARVITEWLSAYINYESLQWYLTLLEHHYQHHHHEFFKNHLTYIEFMAIEPGIKKEIESTKQYIQGVMASGQQKVSRFIKWRLNQILYYWQQTIDITIEHQLEEDTTHETYDKKLFIKELLKIIYAQTLSLKEFIILNYKIKTHCHQVIEDYALPLLVDHHQQLIHINKSKQRDSEDQYAESDFSLLKTTSFFSNASHRMEENHQALRHLQSVEREVKRLYHSPLYFSETAQSDLNDYTIITSKKVVSAKNYFLLGLYIGLGVIIFLSLILLVILDFVEFEKDDAQIGSMTYIFPMFRGVGLLILYLWGMAWNVYGFMKYKINFKLILEYGAHFSNPFQIMKRAGFFTLIFCLMLFLYLVGLEVNKNRATYLPIEYTPFAVWMVYFSYIFFPSKYVFNPKGRVFFYGILKKILLSPFVKMSFLLSFATDQAVSFVTSIKDFAYTVCFYGSDFSVEEVKNCLRAGSFDGVIIGYIAAIIPLLIRMIQCFNQARQSSGKFIGHLQMWNFFKYFSSVVTSTMSFLSSIYSPFFVPFVISSVVSTSYSYYWDLKNDWGFLEKGSKHFLLRSNLSYKNPYIYYAVILVNLVFRCSWTLTISPSLVILIPKSTFLPFLTGFIEILRRCMWNFFRVEKEHVANCSSFSIIKEKPEKILQKIKSDNVKKSFMSNQQSIIEYTKIADIDYTNYLKQTSCKDLPEIKKDDIEDAKKDFEHCFQVVSESQRERSQTMKMKIKTPIKKDYYEM